MKQARMKLAYMYATADVGHSEVTAIQGPLQETLDAIRSAGYSGVEFLVRDPAQLDARMVEAAVRLAGLDVPALCTGEVYGEDGLCFADPDPARRRQAVDRMLSSMELAARFDAPVNVGRLRGRLREDVPEKQSFAWISEAIVECAQAFPEGRIVLEPVNREYANCLTGTKETLAFVEELNLPNLGIMLDVVHMLVEGEDILTSMRMAGDRLWHFHVSDSRRLPVGRGDYDIPAIMEAVLQAKYDGYVTVETFQVPDGLASLRSSAETLERWFRG